MTGRDHARYSGGGNIDPAGLPELPAVMRDGIEQRSADTGHRDGPAELEARLALCDRVAAAVGTPAGGWHTVGAEQAAHQLAARGVDLDTARAMVADYQRETSERVGAPAQDWGLDQGDIDAIAADHQLPTTLTPAVALATLHAAEQGAGEQARAEQLSRWDTDDQAAADSEIDDGVADGSVDEAGWPR